MFIRVYQNQSIAIPTTPAAAATAPIMSPGLAVGAAAKPEELLDDAVVVVGAPGEAPELGPLVGDGDATTETLRSLCTS